MEKYANNNGNSAISAYEIGIYYIWVEFTSRGIYEYTYSSAGAHHIETMKSLALSGSGLNRFIKDFVMDKHSQKIG